MKKRNTILKNWIILFFIFFLQTRNDTFATHNRGARIEYCNQGGNTYSFTITTFTRTSSVQADRPQLDSVYFDNGPPNVFVRDSFADLPGDLRVNSYTKIHTFLNPGTYVIHFSDPNWDQGIINIPNSVNVPLYVEAVLVISPFTCESCSPQFLNDPFFSAAFEKDLWMSHAAYDINNDSLSYELIPCLGVNGTPIPGYYIPAGITLNEYNGEFKWMGNAMDTLGEYSFAVKITKWRQGIYMGHTMEISSIELNAVADTLFDFINYAIYPVNSNGCFSSQILPNQPFNLTVGYYDSSAAATIELYSEITNPLSVITNNAGHIASIDFSWTPYLQNVRHSPYTLVFRGGPGEKDLTYLLYVDGIDSSTCEALISVPEIMLDENMISIFPNPSDGNVQVEINPELHGQFSYCLIDATGKIIFSDNGNKLNNNFYFENLSSGIYVLKIEFESGYVLKRVVVD